MDVSEKVSILLVDDRPENLISLVAILDAPGYDLVKARSGTEALHHLMGKDFALILMDVQMPLMDGFETAALIKKRERSKHVPIIFVTASSPDETFLFRGYNAGAVDYIVKPFEPNILRSKVAVFTELFRKTRQLQQQALLLREREIARIELQSLRREQVMNERYKDLVEGIKDGIVWGMDFHTQAFTFVSAQAERLFTKGHSFFEKAIVENPEFQNYCQNIIRAQLERTEVLRDFSFEHELVSDNGASLWLQTSVRLAPGDGHGPSEIRGLSVDISQVKRAEQEAQSAIRVRDDFLSIASHELKTPLTPLRLQLEILQKMAAQGASKETLGHKFLSYMDRFYRQTDRLAKLIDELLDISRLNNGKLVLEKELVSMSEMVEDVCERCSHTLRASGSTLTLSLQPGVKGRWDRMRVEQILTNLYANAIKYGDGNPIVVTVTADLESAHFAVTDQGIGIKPEDQERVFNLYERAVSPMNFGGLGLGLYIVRQIVEAHGGTIHVSSEYQKGSTFTVGLPLHETKQDPVMPRLKSAVEQGA